MISASVFEAMLAAGATCDHLAIIARQHFPDLASTVDALIAAGSDPQIIAAMLTASAADAGAAAREAERRKRNTDGRRAKRQAAKAAAAQNQFELPMSEMSADIEDSADPPPPSSFPPAPPLITTPSPIDDDGEGARIVSLISAEAHQLASEVAAIAGIDPDPKAWPPGWCGAAMRVQAWLNAGWPPEAIHTGVRTAMASDARKRDGPPTTPFYFEKPIRQAVAALNRPVPALTLTSQQGGPHGQNRGTQADQRPARSAVQFARQRHEQAIAAYQGRTARTLADGGD